MSAEPTLVTQRHFDYISARTTPEDRFLAELRGAAQAAGFPSIWINPIQGAFLGVLLRAAKARVVVEVGTLAGYSAVWMARALPPGGMLHTIEIDPARADFAARWIAQSDAADRVTVHCGAGDAVLPTLAANSADAAFLDADKKGYPRYLEQCLRIVRRGGLILADNAFAFGQLFDEHPTDPEAPAVKAFNDLIARDARLQSIIAPFGDGLWVAVKR